MPSRPIRTSARAPARENLTRPGFAPSGKVLATGPPDLAELLGLRTREEFETWVDQAGLKILGRLNARPHHPKASAPKDPLHAARSREITSLRRLADLQRTPKGSPSEAAMREESDESQAYRDLDQIKMAECKTWVSGFSS